MSSKTDLTGVLIIYLLDVGFHYYSLFIAADRTGQLFVGDAIITVSYFLHLITIAIITV